MHICPICGYNRLLYPPDDGVICPSCGTQFGYTDAGVSHDTLKTEWLFSGLRWHSKVLAPPPGWNPYKQLANLSKANEKRTAPLTEGNHIEILDIGKRVARIQTAPNVLGSFRWQVINLVEGVQTEIAPA